MERNDKPFYSRDPKVVANRILVAAETVFMEDGFAGASTNRVLRRFGGSKATMFRHFPTKDALLLGVIRRIAKRMVDAVAFDSVGAGEPVVWLTRMGATALGTILRDDAIFVGRMVVAQGRNFPELSRTFTEVAVDPLLARLSDQFRCWHDGGLIICLDPEGDALRFFDLLASGWIARSMFGMGPEPSPSFVNREAECAAVLFLNGRRPRT